MVCPQNILRWGQSGDTGSPVDIDVPTVPAVPSENRRNGFDWGEWVKRGGQRTLFRNEVPCLFDPVNES